MGEIIYKRKTLAGVAGDAVKVNFDSTATNLEGNNVQDAIQELDAEVTSLNSSLTNIDVYVGEDEKLHFVDSAGADTVLNFSSEFPYYIEFVSAANSSGHDGGVSQSVIGYIDDVEVASNNATTSWGTTLIADIDIGYGTEFELTTGQTYILKIVTRIINSQTGNGKSLSGSIKINGKTVASESGSGTWDATVTATADLIANQ